MTHAIQGLDWSRVYVQRQTDLFAVRENPRGIIDPRSPSTRPSVPSCRLHRAPSMQRQGGSQALDTLWVLFLGWARDGCFR